MSQDRDLLAKITRKLNIAHSNELVFGEPVKDQGVVLIPVSKISYGFGYGQGSSDQSTKGEGGGGGISASPVGYIELKEGKSRFVRIRQVHSIGSLLLAAAVTSYLLTRLIKSLKSM